MKKREKILEDLTNPDTNSPLREYVQKQNEGITPNSKKLNSQKPSMLNLFP